MSKYYTYSTRYGRHALWLLGPTTQIHEACSPLLRVYAHQDDGSLIPLRTPDRVLRFHIGP